MISLIIVCGYRNGEDEEYAGKETIMGGCTEIPYLNAILIFYNFCCRFDFGNFSGGSLTPN